ncbi:cache domain-containing protein [Candidatus Daviesbacteria bacterium]|nr:cache domain-containing protein [Candidatus Daviesbacteria bacterium]
MPIKPIFKGLIILSPLIIFSFYLIQSQYLEKTDLTEYRMYEVSKLLASTQERYLESTKSLLILLSQLPDLKNPQSENCPVLLATILKQYSLYTNFGVIDSNGDLVCSSIPPDEKVNLSDRQFFQRALNGEFYVGEYRIGRVTGQEIISLGYPIKLVGQEGGVVYASIGLSWLNDLVSQQSLEEDHTLMVLDRKGKILAYPNNEEFIGKSIPDKALLRGIFEAREGVTFDEGLDGREYIYAFTALIGSDDNLYLVLGLPRQDLVADLNTKLSNNLFFLIGAIVLSLILFTISQARLKQASQAA